MTEPKLSCSIVIEREMPHRPEKVWRALTRGALIAEWLMANDFQPIVGHRFSFRETPMAHWNGVTDCEVLVVEPNEQLSYSWNESGQEAAQGLRTVVTWTLTPTKTGVLVRMEQTGIRKEAEPHYRSATYGWQKFVAGLETVAAKLEAVTIAGHPVRYDDQGQLAPWTSWSTALDLEMKFYQQCPADRSYPRFAYVTFLDANWTPAADRFDTIPATQIGMGILSYLKFYELRERRDVCYLNTAGAMGDYLVRESLTPDCGKYPSFTRSTGKRDQFPLAGGAGSQGDRPYEIEPDKGGIAGFALMQLFEATGEDRYLKQGLQNARVLAANQSAGDATRSPWPFRADYRSGAGRGPVSGNMTYILRLYDILLAHGYPEFREPRQRLWTWIKVHQIPSAVGDGALFAQFFEDHETPTNRAAWSPLNLARYLLEKKTALDAEWQSAAGTMIEFVRRNFTHVECGVTVCHEQDEDKEAWGGINSTYGAVLALYAKATGSPDVANEARLALNFTLYSIDSLGRPRDLAKNALPGGWQEDAHTDVIHNYVDALGAFPEWGQAV